MPWLPCRICPYRAVRLRKKVATGTDGGTDLASYLVLQDGKQCTATDCGGQAGRIDGDKNAVLKANGRIRTDNHWFTKPESKTPKSFENQSLTKTPEIDLASHLAQIIQQHPELAKVIDTWPTLSEEQKRIILKIL